MSKIEIFPKAIGKYRLETSKHDQLKVQCHKLLEKELTGKFSKKNDESDQLIHLYNKSHENLLSVDGFSWFEDWIKEKSCDYIENTLGFYLKDGVLITDCWLNVCNKGGFQFYHNHCNSFISGTYYVNFIKGLHSPLEFRNKDLNPENSPIQCFEIPLDKPTKYNSRTAVIDYSEGELLLWESNIAHGYIDENKDNNRISISFNVMPRYLHNQSYGFRLEREVYV